MYPQGIQHSVTMTVFRQTYLTNLLKSESVEARAIYVLINHSVLMEIININESRIKRDNIQNQTVKSVQMPQSKRCKRK